MPHSTVPANANQPKRKQNMTSKTVFVVVYSFVLLPLTAAAGPPAGETQTDRSLFPKSYGLLANEALIFPVDMGDWPLQLDRSRQLLVDDYLLADVENLSREVHPPAKHPDNPVLVRENPWEKGGAIFQFVRRDEQTGRFRMWYAGHVRYALADGTSARFPTLYAESEDGVHWEKPQLGLFPFEGSQANNIVIPGGCLYGLHIDPENPDPAERYTGIVWHEPEHVPREGYFLYHSPDGIHWTRTREAPLAVSLSNYTMPQSGIGDTSIFRFDRQLGKYVGDVKFVLPGKFRCRGMMESEDLIHWTPPRMTLYPDSLDEPDSQVYGHQSFCYQGMWLGMLRMMHTQRTGWKQTTVELTASRDGRHWSRVARREDFLPLGKPGAWDADYHDPSWDLVEVGDELWIYYRSQNRNPAATAGVGNAIGVARLQRDRFVSMNAKSEAGTLVTRPLTFPGRSLFVNADVGKGGYLKAALLSESSEPFDTHTIDKSLPVSSDTLRGKLAWKGAATIPSTGEGHVRLKFEMKNAKLYSFWIE